MVQTMKKIVSVMLSMMLFMAAGAMAEVPALQAETIVGRIVEMREDGSILVERLDSDGQVLVNVPEDSQYDADWALDVDDVIFVTYDGRMARSMPPQVYAQSIRSHSIEGLVAEANTESRRLLINSAELGQVWATLPEGEDAADYADQYVRVFYNGVMALSLPGQVSAVAIDVMAQDEGRVTEIADGYLLMDGKGGALRVNFDAHTKMVAAIEAGDTVQVYYNGITTRSLPPQAFGIVIAKVQPAA